MSELHANGTDGSTPVRDKMTRGETISGSVNAHIYIVRAFERSGRSATDYTPRIIPFFAGITVPLEEGRILWQK